MVQFNFMVDVEFLMSNVKNKSMPVTVVHGLRESARDLAQQARQWPNVTVATPRIQDRYGTYDDAFYLAKAAHDSHIVACRRPSHQSTCNDIINTCSTNPDTPLLLQTGYDSVFQRRHPADRDDGEHGSSRLAVSSMSASSMAALSRSTCPLESWHKGCIDLQNALSRPTVLIHRQHLRLKATW